MSIVVSVEHARKRAHQCHQPLNPWRQQPRHQQRIRIAPVTSVGPSAFAISPGSTRMNSVKIFSAAQNSVCPSTIPNAQNLRTENSIHPRVVRVARRLHHVEEVRPQRPPWRLKFPHNGLKTSVSIPARTMKIATPPRRTNLPCFPPKNTLKRSAPSANGKNQSHTQSRNRRL